MTPSTHGPFNLPALASEFPAQAESLLLDRYLTDEPHASTRLFRVYAPTPAHFHKGSDEHLYVLSGRGRFWMNDPNNLLEVGPGSFLFFPRNTVHATVEILEGPLVFLALDTPRRSPSDIHFITGEAGTPQGFIQPMLKSEL